MKNGRVGNNLNSLLVIDDDPHFGTLLKTVATDSGFQVHVTDDPAEFMRHAQVEEPTAVIIDLRMPRVDGVQLLRQLKEANCRAKVVLASGLDQRTIETACQLGKEFGLNMAGRIEKPIRLGALRRLLTELKKRAVAVTPAALRKGIEQDRLFLVYQPKVRIESGRCVGVEALVRMRTDAGETLLPASFISIAEKREELIDGLTRQVLSDAIRQLGGWRAGGLSLDVAINMSSQNIRDARLPDFIAGLCDEANVPPSSVVLELTETASMHDSTLMMEVLTRFRIKGFRLSMDDFGTGYSSLAQLLRMPFSEIKIDKSFVMEMTETREADTIVKTVVGMGRNLGLAVLAEGVETIEAVNKLQNYGCELAQGYFYSRPVPANDVTQFATSPRQVATRSR